MNGKYSETIISPYIKKQLDSVQIINIVWDTYIDNSFKNAPRNRKEETCSRAIRHSFLRVYKNNTELFHFLSQKLVDEHTFGKKIIAKVDADVVVNV